MKKLDQPTMKITIQKTRVSLAILGLLAVAVLTPPLNSASAKPPRPAQSWITQQTYKGKSYQVAYNTLGDAKNTTVSITDETHTELVRMTIRGAYGLDEAITTACHAHEYLGYGKTIAGCMSTLGSGACLYTGLGAGAGAAFCSVMIEHAAVDGGAVDCLKGLSGIIAKALGEKDAFEFVDAVNFTPSDLIEKSIDKACESWESRHAK